MDYENVEFELARLRSGRVKARQIEMFCGFSTAERSQYDSNQKRIFQLETELQARTAEEWRILESTEGEQEI